MHIYRALTNLRLVIAVSLKMKPAKNPQLHKHTDSSAILASTGQARTTPTRPSARQAPDSVDCRPIVGLCLLAAYRQLVFRARYPAICDFGFLLALRSGCRCRFLVSLACAFNSVYFMFQFSVGLMLTRRLSLRIRIEMARIDWTVMPAEVSARPTPLPLCVCAIIYK